MSRKTQSFLSLTLTNLTCGFNQDIWYALFKVPSLSHQSFSMAVLSQIKHENWFALQFSKQASELYRVALFGACLL